MKATFAIVCGDFFAEVKRNFSKLYDAFFFVHIHIVQYVECFGQELHAGAMFRADL